MSSDRLDGRRLEEDWEHALDAAGDALDTTARSRTLPSADAADGSEHIREERKWLGGFRSTLHRLFPSTRDSD